MEESSYPTGYLSRSTTMTPPPRYQPVDEGAPSISSVIGNLPSREEHNHFTPNSSVAGSPPLPPPRRAPSVHDGPPPLDLPPPQLPGPSQGHGQPSPRETKKLPIPPQTRMQWTPPEGNSIVEEERHYASSSSSSGKVPSPTMDPNHPPHHAYPMNAAASNVSYQSTSSEPLEQYNGHSRGRSSYEQGNQYYHNGVSSSAPSNYPPTTLRAPEYQQRRESVGSNYDPHQQHHPYTSHPNPSVISHGSANGRPPSDPGERQPYPGQNPYPQQYNQPSPPLPPPTRPHAASVSTGQPRSDVTMYYFRSSGYNTMTLYTFDGRPQYHVEVAMNCFNPSSHITTIRRATPQGEIVASFEMGISAVSGTLTFGPANYWLKEVFQNFRTAIKSNAKGRWLWKRGECEMEWNSTNDPESRCHNIHDTKKKTLAKIIPPTKLGRTRDTLLEVHISAQHMLDDIVVSSIIVEGKRQIPTKGSNNEELFN